MSTSYLQFKVKFASNSSSNMAGYTRASVHSFSFSMIKGKLNAVNNFTYLLKFVDQNMQIKFDKGPVALPCAESRPLKHWKKIAILPIVDAVSPFLSQL